MAVREYEPNAVLPTKEFNVVGTRPVRHDGADKVTGRALYGADFAAAGLLHGKVLRSPHAHAVIKSIDTSKAEALDGVHAVVTAADYPDSGGDKPTNVAFHLQQKLGDTQGGFAAADVVIEREFNTKTVHQGYIEPHNSTALWNNDGQLQIAAPRARSRSATRWRKRWTFPCRRSRSLRWKSAANSVARSRLTWTRRRRCCRRGPGDP